MRGHLGEHGALWIVPEWSAPANVRAFVTTRAGGVSGGEYASLNLGARSGDSADNVARNRAIVREHLPAMPRWLAQVHGTAVATVDTVPPAEVPVADAAVAHSAGHVCAVLTADCLPVLLTDAAGTRVAVAHAGWRGMAAGVIENTVRALGGPPGDLVAWLGPAIGPETFEVGIDVHQAFTAGDAGAADAFRPHGDGKYLADLYALARQRLARAGVGRISGGGFCTLRDAERFYSYRREKHSGRMGAFIWIA
jgi:YfiH family protein